MYGFASDFSRMSSRTTHSSWRESARSHSSTAPRSGAGAEMCGLRQRRLASSKRQCGHGLPGCDGGCKALTHQRHRPCMFRSDHHEHGMGILTCTCLPTLASPARLAFANQWIRSSSKQTTAWQYHRNCDCLSSEPNADLPLLCHDA